jgi:FkbM family methyltransferase
LARFDNLSLLRKYTTNWYDVIFLKIGLKKRAILKLKGKYNLKFEYVPRMFALYVFAQEPYKRVTVEGKDVVDAGAFNGDSSIYFSVRGAKKVYAFEPFPFAFQVAQENISLNNITNITIFNEGLSSQESTVTIDESYHSDSSSNVAQKFAHGKTVRIRPLHSLVREFSISNAVLKLDCEGCEYKVLLEESDETIYSFSEIILEYHDGSSKLVQRLQDLGYQVTLLNIDGSVALTRSDEKMGLLYASRN